jgi:heme/copper-type cytochrome/quinol oxidase subunit 4
MTTLNRIPGSNKHTNYVLGAWLVLMTLTAASWWLGANHEIGNLGRDFSIIGILVLTFMKAFVVGHSFMELREAAPWLVRTFAAWCVVVCCVLSVMYLAI